METTIKYRDIELIVTGEYIKGESPSYDYERIYEDFLISTITVSDSEVNIKDLFYDDDIEEICELVIENLR